MTDPIVRLENMQLSVEPGDEVKTSVTVRNLGTMVEDFRLEVLGEGASEWSDITPPEVRLHPGQETTVHVVFSPPAESTTRRGIYPFAVRAESVVDADISALAEGDLEIGRALGPQADKPTLSKRPATLAAVLILVLGGLIAFVLIRVTDNEPASEGLAQGMPRSPSLAATSPDASSIRLLWGNQPNIESYRIVQVVPDDGSTKVTTVDGASDTFLLADLAPDTDYCFRLEAVRGHQTSPSSAIQCVHTPGSPSPTESAPSSVPEPNGGGVPEPPGGGMTSNSTLTAASPSPETTSLTATPSVGASGAPPTSGATSTTSASPDDLANFQENCEQQFTTKQWHTGNVLYPRSMVLQLGSTTTYDAIVELGDAGIPPKQTIAAADPAAEPVLVQCLISAKLVSVDGDTEVGSDTTELTESDGWYLQTFTPTGTVEWTWTVTPHAPGVHNLQFLLRPAVAYGGSTTGSTTGQQAYFTQITVNASTMENVSYWFDTQFTTLGKIIGVLGTAIIGVLTWLVLFSETWGKLRKRTSSQAATESDSGRRAVTRRGEHGRRSGPRTQAARRSPRR